MVGTKNSGGWDGAVLLLEDFDSLSKKKSATMFGLDFAWTIHDGDDDDDDDKVDSSWTQPLASHFSDGPNISRIIKILSSESSPKNQNGFVRFF